MVRFTRRFLAWSLLAAAVQLGHRVQAANLLIVGDSHSCGSFGAKLLADFSAAGDQVDLFCSVSSAATHWVRGLTPEGQICQFSSSHSAPTLCGGTGEVPKITNLLQRKHYDKVLIALGTNSLADPVVDVNTRTLAQTIHPLPCVWVGPPHLRPDQAKGFSAARLRTMEGNLTSFYGSLHAAVSSGCQVIDSRGVTSQGLPAGESVDGVHRSKTAGQIWADALANSILNGNQ